ncbi:MAG: tRNA threonylcarbamoyladenosine dehydratase [Oscillospiraceae bacterium]|nr:tRNA threonylcarbamoyladenosine dehydratase [Oscillospiraceae bacterium]
MSDQFQRTRMLLGGDAVEKLVRSRVAVFGLGGVGGYAVEALCRSGVGALDLVDSDKIALSNLNRQIIALHSTLGMDKTEAAAARARDINPACEVRTYRTFYLPGESTEFDFAAFDYVVDAIDTVTGKLGLILAAREAGTPIISAMGTGNKLDPTLLRVSDITETSVCPLARIMRKELRRRGVEHLKVVWSPEEPRTAEAPSPEEPSAGRRSIPGSVAFVPAAAGLILAAEVVKDLCTQR